MRFSFIKLIQIRVDNARVFQGVSMNLNTIVAACRLVCRCRYTQSRMAASHVCWIAPTVRC